MENTINSTLESITSQPTISPVRIWIAWIRSFVRGDIFLFYLGPCIIVGLVLNLLTFVLMLRPSMRKLSSTIYLQTLAISDCLCLIGFIGNDWVPALGIYIGRALKGWYEISDLLCKIHWIYTYFSLTYAAWLVVLMTGERCVVVLWPLKARAWCTRRVASYAVGGLFVMVLILSTAYTLIGGISLIGACDLRAHRRFAMQSGHWLRNALYSYIPSALLFGMNLTIIVAIVRQARKRGDMVHTNQPPQAEGRSVATISENAQGKTNASDDDKPNELPIEDVNTLVKHSSSVKDDGKTTREPQIQGPSKRVIMADSERRATRMVLVVSIFYLICTFPGPTLQNFHRQPEVFPQLQTSIAFYWIAELVRVLLPLNNVLNFVLYVVMSRAFRQELRRMFRRVLGTAGNTAAKGGKALPDSSSFETRISTVSVDY